MIGRDEFLDILGEKGLADEVVKGGFAEISDGLVAGQGDGEIIRVEMLLTHAAAPAPVAEQPDFDAMAAIGHRLVAVDHGPGQQRAAGGGSVEILGGLVVAETGAEEALVAAPVAGLGPIGVGLAMERIGPVILVSADAGIVNHGMDEAAGKVGLASSLVRVELRVPVGHEPCRPIAADAILRHRRQGILKEIPFRHGLGRLEARPAADRAADDLVDPDVVNADGVGHIVSLHAGGKVIRDELIPKGLAGASLGFVETFEFLHALPLPVGHPIGFGVEFFGDVHQGGKIGHDGGRSADFGSGGEGGDIGRRRERTDLGGTGRESHLQGRRVDENGARSRCQCSTHRRR